MVKNQNEERAATKLGFIGAGVVGTALALRLHEKGYPVVAVASRSESSAEKLADAVSGCQAYKSKQVVADVSDLVLITTPDDNIPEVVLELSWRAGQSVIHCSGVDSLDVLQKAKDDGAYVGGFHPLQTFASLAKAIENIPGSTFALEAEEPLLSILKGMTEALEGNYVVLGLGDKPLYHAAAVIACNYTVTLMKMATDLWRTFGVSPDEATKAIMPLLHGTINNIENVGLPNCLTGPIARGDVGTVLKHLEAMEERVPDVIGPYCEMGLQTIPVALSKGKINVAKAEELRLLLTKSKTEAYMEVL